MKTIKRLALLLFALTAFTACTKTEYTGDTAILAKNKFLQDKNHVLTSMSLEKFLGLLEEQEKGTIEETNDDDEKVTRDRTDAEKRTVVIFGKQGENRNDIVAYLANEAAKSSSYLDKVKYVVLVDLSSERTDYKNYFDSEANEDEEDNHEMTVGNYYERLLLKAGISDTAQGKVKFKFDNLWPFGRTCDTVTGEENIEKSEADLNKIDLAKRIPNTGCAAGSQFVVGRKISDTTIMSFNEGKFVSAEKFLFDDRVLDSSNVEEIYDLNDDETVKTFNEKADCQIFGKDCGADKYIGVQGYVQNIFKAVVGM